MSSMHAQVLYKVYTFRDTQTYDLQMHLLQSLCCNCNTSDFMEKQLRIYLPAIFLIFFQTNDIGHLELTVEISIDHKFLQAFFHFGMKMTPCFLEIRRKSHLHFACIVYKMPHGFVNKSVFLRPPRNRVASERSGYSCNCLGSSRL